MSNLNLVSTTDAPDAVSHALGNAGKEHSEAPAAAAQAEDESAADSETAEEHSEADEAKEQDSSEAKKSKGGFQKRISKLTGERDRLIEEREALKRQLAGKAQNAPAAKSDEIPKPKPSEQNAESGNFDKPKPKLEEFDSIEQFTEAVADWKAEERDFKRTQADRQRAAQAERQQLVDQWKTRSAEAQAKHEDYDDALEAVAHIKIPPAHQQALLECEHGPEIAYELAKNPEELKRIAALSPLAAARALGRLEAKFQQGEATAPKTETKASNAPRPIRPVSGGSKTSASTKSPDQMSYREYCAWRDSKR